MAGAPAAGSLTEEQDRARQSPTDEPLSIEACAGSGKTKTLIFRLELIISLYEIAPEAILVFSFSRAACEELKARLKASGNARTNPLARIGVQTYHAFCLSVLRERPEVADAFFRLGGATGEVSEDGGQDGGRGGGEASATLATGGTTPAEAPQQQPEEAAFQVVDENKQRFKVGEILEDLQTRNVIQRSHSTNIRPAAKYLRAINRAKARNLPPDDSSLTANQRIVYREYEESMKAARCLDFCDMLKAVMYSLQQPASPLLAELTKRHTFILVDEFQDTSTVQLQLLHLLARDGRVTVVGDPSQRIYGFQGAGDDQFGAFRDRYQAAPRVKLTQNFRGQPVEACSCATPEHEMFWVLLHILMLKGFIDGAGSGPLQQPSCQWKDIAIICRKQSTLTEFQKFLEGHNIPLVVRGAAYYSQREVEDILAICRKELPPPNGPLPFITCLTILSAMAEQEVPQPPPPPPPDHDTQDGHHHHQQPPAPHRPPIKKQPPRAQKLPKKKDRERVARRRREQLRLAEPSADAISRFEQRVRAAVGRIHVYEEKPDGPRQRVHENEVLNRAICAACNVLDKSCQLTDRLRDLELSEFLHRVVKKLPQSRDYGALIEALQREAKAYTQQQSPAARLSGFLDAIALSDDATELLAEKASTNNERNASPSPQLTAPRARSSGGSGPDSQEEERRVAYVALSRAKEQLRISFVEIKLDNNKPNRCSVSPYLADLPPDPSPLVNRITYSHIPDDDRTAVKRALEQMLKSLSGAADGTGPSRDFLAAMANPSKPGGRPQFYNKAPPRSRTPPRLPGVADANDPAGGGAAAMPPIAPPGNLPPLWYSQTSQPPAMPPPPPGPPARAYVRPPPPRPRPPADGIIARPVGMPHGPMPPRGIPCPPAGGHSPVPRQPFRPPSIQFMWARAPHPQPATMPAAAAAPAPQAKESEREREDEVPMNEIDGWIDDDYGDNGGDAEGVGGDGDQRPMVSAAAAAAHPAGGAASERRMPPTSNPIPPAAAAAAVSQQPRGDQRDVVDLTDCADEVAAQQQGGRGGDVQSGGRASHAMVISSDSQEGTDRRIPHGHRKRKGAAGGDGARGKGKRIKREGRDAKGRAEVAG
ncbi:unnamed protein product [Vitrella brassicaformis CCMP3155]|uniref:UvrD-like helicase ATP-binding domain-containing protein n=1 Tax=Vitrella brassicaformis (strain CCMP3155) TaxID=1169540 RepID=A0A0G4FUM4_VITBC|nr:unnamed protein product [Vitrella brassicaformis CCMP3155]|eukprot:CEM18644.1 unnamed protein product [Vitrella brassicaformis CCMP3155]